MAPSISHIVKHGLHVCWRRHRNKALGSVQLDWPETADTWGAECGSWAGRGAEHGGVSSVQQLAAVVQGHQDNARRQGGGQRGTEGGCLSDCLCLLIA